MPVREIAFELDCFEWADERLEVAGRWKGLAGRRLNRPVLTVEVDGGRRKHLVALAGGQLGGAEDIWRAAFEWSGDPADITAAELEVGGSVVVDLPLPDRKRRRRRRPAAEAGDEALRAEAGALRAQVERLRAELAARERENMQLSAQLEAGAGEHEDVAEAGAPTVEIERLAGERQELTAEIERMAGERDRTRTELSAEVERLQAERAELTAEVERLQAERSELTAEVERLHREHDGTRVELERLRVDGERLQNEIDELRQAFSDAAAEAEEARDRHRAELTKQEHELRAERAAVARLTAQLAQRPELPPPATESARRAAAAPARDQTQPLPSPFALDPPGPLRAGSRPADQPGAEHGARPSKIPAWLRGGRRDEEDTAGAEAGADEAGRAQDEPEGRSGGEPGRTSRAASTTTARRAAGGDVTEEARGRRSPAGARVAVENGAGEEAAAGPAMPSLQALKARLEGLFASNGRAAVADAPAAQEDALPGPRRSASAARARAGATVAARRSSAELWALRIAAAALVAVLLIAFLLILTSIA